MESRQGDAGRLAYISDSLQMGKTIFQSDKDYLHKKISASVIPNKIRQPTETDTKLKNVQRLISWNFGDPDRLNYMLRCLQNNRGLSNSDEEYLELKTSQVLQFLEEEKLKQSMPSRISANPNYETYNNEFYTATSKAIRKIPFDEQPSLGKPTATKKTINRDFSLKTKETMDLSNLIRHDPQANLGIDKERLDIGGLKNQHDLTKTKNGQLPKIKNFREDHEIQINHEKELLEKEINLGQKKFNEKILLVEELKTNQSKIIQAKSEREILAMRIGVELASSELELRKKQDQLEDLKKECDKISRQLEIKRQDSNMVFSTEKPAKLKKENLRQSLKGKLEVILVALGTIFGFSVMFATLADVWPCDVLRILNIPFPFFC